MPKEWYFTNITPVFWVKKAASDEEIKKAHRKIAHEWHPDKYEKGLEEERLSAEKKIVKSKVHTKQLKKNGNK